jgi:phage terminase small subunit
MPRSRAELDAPPPLELVSPSLPVELPAPPSHLSSATQNWWRSIVSDFDLQSHHLKVLECACDAWDRMVQARTTIAEEGLTVMGGVERISHRRS